MCGIITLQGRVIEIDCQILDEDWWRHPWPPVDLTRIRIEDDRTDVLQDWRVELTKIGDMLGTVARLRDGELSDRLGRVLVETGNRIAADAGVDITFEWAAHQRGGRLNTPARAARG